MTIKVIIKDAHFFDDGLLICENVQDYIIDKDNSFLEIHFNCSEIIFIKLSEIEYFRIIRK